MTAPNSTSHLREIMAGLPVTEPVKLSDGWPPGLLDSPALIVEHLRQALPEIAAAQAATPAPGHFGYAYLFCQADPHDPVRSVEELHLVRIRPIQPRMEAEAIASASKLFALTVRCVAERGRAACVAFITGARLVRASTGAAESHLMINVMRRDQPAEIWTAPIGRSQHGQLPVFERISEDGTSMDLLGMDRALQPLPDFTALNAACDATGFPVAELVDAWDSRGRYHVHLVLEMQRSLHIPVRNRYRLVAELLERDGARFGELVAEARGPWVQTVEEVAETALNARAPLEALGLLTEWIDRPLPTITR